MKRVQIILEEWQHDWLSKEAAKHSSTISALLRQLLTEAIERQQAANLSDDPLWGIIGLAEGPDDGITSENLDQFLYNLNGQSQPARIIAEPSTAMDKGYAQIIASDR